MYNKIKSMWGIFKDNNDWNEKNVVGFIAFLVMVVFALLDLITGYFIYFSSIRLLWYRRFRKIRKKII